MPCGHGGAWAAPSLQGEPTARGWAAAARAQSLHRQAEKSGFQVDLLMVFELCPGGLESDQCVAACCRMMMCKRQQLIKQLCALPQWHASPTLCSGGTAGKEASAFPGL